LSRGKWLFCHHFSEDQENSGGNFMWNMMGLSVSRLLRLLYISPLAEKLLYPTDILSRQYWYALIGIEQVPDTCQVLK